MARNIVIVGKPSLGKTTKFDAVKVCTEQLKRVYTIEDVKEFKLNTIGFLQTTK
ncbi:hypothetical protein R4576_18175 [Acinetobacter baumannii]|nr:hypothetical protein [Acinetobacter baumannii]